MSVGRVTTAAGRVVWAAGQKTGDPCAPGCQCEDCVVCPEGVADSYLLTGHMKWTLGGVTCEEDFSQSLPANDPCTFLGSLTSTCPGVGTVPFNLKRSVSPCCGWFVNTFPFETETPPGTGASYVCNAADPTGSYPDIVRDHTNSPSVFPTPGDGVTYSSLVVS